MHGHMVDLQWYKAASGERNFHRANQGSNLFGASFSNRDNVRTPIELEDKVSHSNLKDNFP